MVKGESIKVATERIECNASLFLRAVFDEEGWRDTKMTFKELRAVVEARNNNWYIVPGQEYRSYWWAADEWGSPLPEDQWDEVCEIPAISSIVARLDMYPPVYVENPYE